MPHPASLSLAVLCLSAHPEDSTLPPATEGQDIRAGSYIIPILCFHLLTLHLHQPHPPSTLPLLHILAHLLLSTDHPTTTSSSSSQVLSCWLGYLSR